MQYYFSIVDQILLLVMLAAAFNILFGYAGQASMATGAIYGIGAYTAGRLTIPALEGAAIPGLPVGLGKPVLVGLVVAAIVGGIASLVIAIPALSRVSGDYLILLTLAFQVIATQVMVAALDVTGGANGLTMVPPLSIFGKLLTQPGQVLVALLPITIVVVVLCTYLGAAPYGRLLRSMREHEIAVRAVGKGTTYPKIAAFALSGLVMAFVGGLTGSYYQVVTPTMFDLSVSVLIVSIVVLGGAGNQVGAVIAAVALGLVQPLTQKIAGDASIQWQGVAYGLALVLMIRFRPQGLLPEGTRLRTALRISRKPRTSPVATVTTSEGPAAPGRAPARLTSRSADALQPTAGGVLKVTGLAKAFGGVRAVDGVDFVLPGNIVTGLVGPNGAGKTTVFNLITNTITPDTGDVELRGSSISGLSTVQIAKLGMTRSFQDGRLFMDSSALDNVAMAVPGQPGENPVGLFVRPLASRKREKAVRLEAMEALEFVGLAGRADDRVANMSYGDQRLVAIARLIATNGDILLLDEPTAGVDPGSVEDVIQVVRDLKSLGKTICLVEHSIHLMGQLADHILFMDRGRVIAEGTLDDLMAQPELTEIYFGT